MAFQDSSWNIRMSSLLIKAEISCGKTDRQIVVKTLPSWLPSQVQQLDNPPDASTNKLMGFSKSNAEWKKL